MNHYKFNNLRYLLLIVIKPERFSNVPTSKSVKAEK